MKRKLIRIGIVEIISAMVLFLTFTTAFAAQKTVSFTGDVLINESNSTIKAKLYVKGPEIRRVDMSKEAGGAIFICPKEARGKIWMLDPEKKQYRILSWPEKHTDPVDAWTDIQYDMRGGAVGHETLNEHPCTIYQFKYPGKDTIALKMWYAEDIHYAIKREANAKIVVKKNANPKIITGRFQILNIKVEKLDDALFKIPSDYTEIK